MPWTASTAVLVIVGVRAEVRRDGAAAGRSCAAAMRIGGSGWGIGVGGVPGGLWRRRSPAIHRTDGRAEPPHCARDRHARGIGCRLAEPFGDLGERLPVLKPEDDREPLLRAERAQPFEVPLGALLQDR